MSQDKVRKARVWQKILKSSTSMEEAAKKNDWSGLNELIESRQLLLSQFFKESTAEGHALELEKIREDIRLIKEQDKRTQQLSRQNKSLLAAELKKLKTGKAAVLSYR